MEEANGDDISLSFSFGVGGEGGGGGSFPNARCRCARQPRGRTPLGMACPSGVRIRMGASLL
eukprot:5238645-Pyramimonas_sp.AAC.1